MSVASVNKALASLSLLGDSVLDRRVGQVEKELVRIYRENQKAIRKILAEIYAKFGSDVTFSEMQKFNRLSKVEAELTAALKGLGVKTRQRIRKAVGEVFERQYYIAGYEEELIGINAGFGGLSEDVIKANIVNPMDLIKWPTRNTRNIALLNGRIRDRLAEGLIQGYGYQKTSRLLREEIDRTMFETLRIVRTEGQRAKSAAKNIAQQKIFSKANRLGIDLEKVWDATRDGRTRPEHRGLDGRVANENGQWIFSNGIVTSGPALSGNAKMDIHCRCFVRTQIAGASEGFEPETIREFGVWAKDKGIKAGFNVN